MYSIWIVPRNRSTSSYDYGRVIPDHRELVYQSSCECFGFPLAPFFPFDAMSISLRKVAALSPEFALVKNELRYFLGRIEFVPPDHFFAQTARFAE